MFCPLPWIHIAIRNNGDLRVCCHANQGPDRGLLRKDDNTIYNASIDNIVESRNCKKLKDIRLQLLNNIWPDECVRCMREESSGIKSRFTYEKEIWNKYFDESKAIEFTKSDGSIDVNRVPSAYFDMRLGNKCNSKCRICSPTDSSLWYEDHYKTQGKYYHETSKKMQIVIKDGIYTVSDNIYNWYESESFWEYMINTTPNIKMIHMVGGEPLLIDQQFNYLQKCIDLDYAKDMTIEYNTNLSYLPEKALELWSNFKIVKIGGSIDGIEKVGEYIRYPIKWDKVLENLNKLDNTNDNIRVWFTITISVFNILHLPDFFNWTISNPFKKINSSKYQPLGSLHPVHAPKYLNVKILPYPVKKKIKEYFDSCHFSKHDKIAKNLLNKYSNFMFQEDYSDELPTFFRITDMLDEIRNQKLKDSIPNLYNLIGEYK